MDIYMCCMDGSAYEIKFDFLVCFLLVFCLLLNDRHVKLLRNPSFRFMWSKSNKFLLNLYHKINPIAIFFHYEMRMMFTNRLNSRAPCFFICVSKFIITMTSSYSRTHFHKVHDMHFPRLIWKRDFSRITNACTINLLYDVSFFTGHSFKVVRGPLEVVAILLNLSIRASNVKVCWFYQRSRLANEQYLYWIVLVLITLIRYFKSTQ